MLWTIIGIILLIWLLGVAFSIAGKLIHLLIVAAGIIFILKLIKESRSR